MEDDNNHSWLNDLLILIIAICLISIGCISCKSVQYIPVPSVKSDSTYNNTLRVDSFIKFDSIYLHEYVKGDTVYRDREVTRWRDRKKEVHDTVYITKADSIYVPYQVEVERDLTWWEQTKVSLGGAAILLSIILMIILRLRR